MSFLPGFFPSYIIESPAGAAGLSFTITSELDGSGFFFGYVDDTPGGTQIGSIDHEPIAGNDLWFFIVGFASQIAVHGNAMETLAGTVVYVDGVPYPFDGLEWTYSDDTPGSESTGGSWAAGAPPILAGDSYFVEFVPTNPVPSSFVFNGTDEALVRTLVTSAPGTTRFTYSVWMKIAAFDGSNQASIFEVINDPTNDAWLSFSVQDSGDTVVLEQSSDSEVWSEAIGAIDPDVVANAWQHIVIRYDSTQATDADRIRIYLNGVLIEPDPGAGAPTLNEAHRLFTNGRQHQIGAWLDVPSFFNGKLAFIDVVDGLSLDPTEFAEDVGFWRRKKYTGSYGTYGFSLDGTDGFNDVSGNGQHFTGQNMTTDANLDISDLPFYINP